MNSPDPRLGRLLLLGKNYGAYGAIGSTNVGTDAAAGISVGSDLDSPSKQWKYDSTVDNEDSLCVIAAPDWIGMAVADAHYGPESSHMLLDRLHTIWAKVRPAGIEHLGQMIEFLRQGDPAQTDSETTLLAVVYDRSSRKGFGISFGDSTFTITGRNRIPVPLNEHDSRFVSAGRRNSLRDGSPFEFEARSGELLLAFTDGVDGCHYRQPETSVQPEHIQEIAVGANMDPLETVNEVITFALKGVDGNPGGQDNIAMIAARA
ncbi:MAG: hypothetical protein ACI81L_000151 [Verrucomicrobiales bacterium]|jgi:hypothetical protein